MLRSSGYGRRGEPGPVGAQGVAGAQGPKGDTGAASTVPGPKGDVGPRGDTGAQGMPGSPANTLIGTVSIAQSAQLLAVQVGIKDITADLGGTVVGERYQAFIRRYKLNGAATYTAGRPAGYCAVDAACNVAGKITVSHNTPGIALLGGSYELVCDIVRINT
jgi:hypothetical protein